LIIKFRGDSDLFYSLVLLAALQAAPATNVATTSQAQNKPDLATNAKDPNEKICKRMMVTGSVARQRKICHTRAEWDKLTEHARDDTAKLQEGANNVRSN
jgi:hypothetical protein